MGLGPPRLSVSAGAREDRTLRVSALGDGHPLSEPMAVVLLQAGQGGGLASMGGGTTDLVMGGRQAVTILHKMSWITGGVFMFLLCRPL